MFKKTRELLLEREAQRAASAATTFAERSSKSSQDLIYNVSDLKNRVLLVEQGTIQDVVPFLRLYRVALLKGHILNCTYAADVAFQPLGVSDNTILSPGTTVLVARLPNETYGIIISVIPDFVKTYGDSYADELVQGSNVGFFSDLTQKSIMYYQPPGGGGISAWKDVHVDALPGDWARFSRLGAALFVSDFLSGFRLNEYCGLWLNYFDSLLRIAGLNYQLWTGGSEEYSMLYWKAFLRYRGYGYSIDSQLGKRLEGSATDPFLTTNASYYEHPDAHVSNVEHISIARGETSSIARLPQHKVQEWEGILGQGGAKWLISNKYKDTGTFPVPDAQECITAHGTYIVQSRSGILLAKYPFISAPVRVSDPDEAYGKPSIEDFEDDFESFLTKLSNINFTGKLPLISTTHILDIRNLLCNWEATAGFYLLPKKFKFIKETELYNHFQQGLKLAQGSSAYSPAFFYMDPFGDIIIQNGQGARIELRGGSIRISAPENIYIDAGSNTVVFGKDVKILSESELNVAAKTTLRLQVKKGQITEPTDDELKEEPLLQTLYDYKNKDQMFIMSNTGKHYLSGCYKVEYMNTLHQKVGACVSVSEGGSYSALVLPVAYQPSPWLYNIYVSQALNNYTTSEMLRAVSLRACDMPYSVDESGLAKLPGDVGSEAFDTITSSFPGTTTVDVGLSNMVLVKQG